MRNPRTVLTITSLDQFRMVDGHPMVTERGKWVRLAPHEFDSIAHQAGWRPDLFDATDQFRLDVEGGERSLGDILGDVEADEAAIKAARDCL